LEQRNELELDFSHTPKVASRYSQLSRAGTKLSGSGVALARKIG